MEGEVWIATWESCDEVGLECLGLPFMLLGIDVSPVAQVGVFPLLP